MAYSVTNDYKLALANSSIIAKSYFTILPEETVVSGDTYLQSWKLENLAYDDESDNLIGNTVCKKLELQMINEFSLELENKEIQLYAGLVINPDDPEDEWEIEYVDYGKFIVQPVVNSETPATKKFIAYDYMIKFNQLFYSDETIAFPCTILEMLQYICIKCGVTIGEFTLPNYLFEIESDETLSSYRFRDIINRIAKISGTIACIKSDELNMIKFGSTVETIIDKTKYYEFERNKYWVLNELVLNSYDIEGENMTESNSASVTEFGLMQMTIQEELFANTQDKRVSLIDELWTNLDGINYYPFKMRAIGINYLDPLDKIQIKDKDNVTYNTYVFNQIINFSFGKLSVEFETVALTSSEVELKNIKADVLASQRTEITVKKQEALIDLTVEKTVVLESQISTVNDQILENSNDINALEDANQNIQTTLSQIEIAVGQITETVQIQGGSNSVDNSVMLLGEELYTVTDTQLTPGTIISGKITDLIGKSVSETGYVLQNKKIVHDVIKGFVVGKQYTLTFKYSNQALNSLKVVLDNLDDETVLETTESAILEEVVYTFTAKSNEISYSVESDYADDTLISLITDFIIKSGNVRADWEPAIGEIIGTNLVIYYNGVKVTSPSQVIETNINNLGFVVINTSNGSVVLQCTKDGIITNNLTVNGTIYQGVFVTQQLTISGDAHLMIS